MNLMDVAQLLGNFGEFFGAIAVVATLAYLAIQIRNQNREARAGSVHEILDAFRRQNAVLGRSDIAALYMKGSPGIENLTETEKYQMHTINYGFHRIFEEAFYQYREGRLDSDQWEAIDAHLRMILGVRGIQQDWMTKEDVYDKAFTDLANAIVEKHGDDS